MEYKLLVINPHDEQEIIVINKSGGYYDQSRVLWDERSNGIFPSNMVVHLGYLKVVNSSLVIDDNLKILFEEQLPAKQLAKDLKQCLDNRKKEYPSIEDCVHAILDNDLAAIQFKRAEVKLKYPKPS